MYVMNYTAAFKKKKKEENEIRKYMLISKNMFQDENMYLAENKTVPELTCNSGCNPHKGLICFSYPSVL